MRRKSYTIDASGKTLGRLASEAAILLQGKNRPNYSPNIDGEDEVTLINTSKINVTGGKLDSKKYYKHSGYLGGIKEITYRKLFARDPNEVIKKAIYGMLPKNKLRAKAMRRLKLYKHDRK